MFFLFKPDFITTSKASETPRINFAWPKHPLLLEWAKELTVDRCLTILVKSSDLFQLKEEKRQGENIFDFCDSHNDL